MIFRLEIQMLNCFIDAFVEHLDRYEKLGKIWGYVRSKIMNGTIGRCKIKNKIKI